MTIHAFTVLSDQDFYAVLSSAPGVSVVFFTNPGCASCRAWRAVLHKFQGERPQLQIYEVDAQTSSALTQEYAIFHLPALFVFVDGEFHAPLQCEARVSVLHAAVTSIVSAPAMEAP